MRDDDHGIWIKGEGVRRVSFAEWMKYAETVGWWKDDENKRVAFSGMRFASGAEVEVSTVFLRIDHGFYKDRPLWFETMVFGGELAEECERYATEEDAMAGHMVMLSRVILAHELDGPIVEEWNTWRPGSEMSKVSRKALDILDRSDESISEWEE